MKTNFYKQTRGVLLAGLSLSAAFAVGTSKASAQLFTAGDLVVTTYGDTGTATANGSYVDGQTTPITLEEFASAIAANSTPVLKDTLPITNNGNNVGITGEYGSSSEGTLQLSGNGQYLTIGGYDAVPAFAGNYSGSTSAGALGQSTDTNVPRVAALIDANGSVNTTTVLNDVYNTNNPRSVYSPDGTSIYLSGQGAGKTDEGGLYHTTTGTNTTTGGSAPTGIFNVVSTRTVQGYNGNLYYSADQNSSSKGTLTGIFEYSGDPTTAQGSNTGTRLTLASSTVNGKTVNFSPEGFVFANPTTLYVADTGDPKAGGTGDGGIQKWVLSGTTWSLQYTLTDPNFVAASSATSVAHGETGFEALTLQVVNGVADIYAVSYTAGDADPNGLYGIADTLSLTTGAGETFTEIAASAADTNFKGVSFAPQAVPEPSSWVMMLGGLGGLLFVMGWRRSA